METYFERKQLYRARIKIMLKYLQTDKECRSGFISRYFGEDNSKDCGVCDNCLNRKNIGITEDEFKKIEEFITSHLSGPSTFTVKELLLQLNGIPKDHFWEVITFLQGEGKIKIDERGLVTKR
jgi:ATP-dependent DNA helicase RecQ